MKIKKNLGLVLATVTATSVLAFSGCDLLNSFLPGTSSTEEPTGKNALTMEAEYIDIDDVAGAGISNNTSGLSMIYGDGTDAQKKIWSNGYYVGYTHNSTTELEFVFNSSKATTANITFMLGSEIGDITLNSDSITILVNSEEQNLPNWWVAGSEMDTATFTACKLSSLVSLKEGENKIVFKVIANNLGGNGITRGPHIDCVKVTATDTGTELSWTPHTDNPERRDNQV